MLIDPPSSSNRPHTDGNAGPISVPTRLRRWLHVAANAVPQAIALEAPGVSLTYAQLRTRVAQLSDAWRAHGLRAGDRIGIAASRSAETIVQILAAVDAELAYVPLDMAYPADRLRAMLEQAQVRAVVGSASDLMALKQAVGPIPTPEQLAQAPATPAVAPSTPVAPTLYASGPDPVYVLFTSGSTGEPKGVAMSQAPLGHLIDWHAGHERLGRPGRTLLFAPLSFDVHFQEIVSSVACRGTMVLITESQRRDPERLRQAITSERIDRLFLPYIALQMLAEADKDQEGPPLPLTDVVSAGEQLQITPAIRALFRRLPEAVLHNHYGPTESHVVTACELAGPVDDWPPIPPIGQALPHVRIALLDPETDLPTQAAQGEMLLGGDCLALGYLGRQDLSDERFRLDIGGLPGRWYTTGDLVQRAPDGVLSYLGRADQQLKVDGFRIEPGEIELALMAMAEVQDAVVTAPDVPGSGRQLIAHLVLRAGAPDLSQLSARIRSRLREQLPEYMVPVRLVSLDRLPTTPSGKIDRRQLPLPMVTPATPGCALEGVQDGARTTQQLQALIREIWQDLLGLAELDDRANVFDLGARSLLVLRLVARVKDAGVRISVADVYDQPTVHGLARALGGAVATGSTERKTRSAQPSSFEQVHEGIAIVGMAVRTAGAADLDTFWSNLLADREGIRRFALHELDASLPLELRQRPNFVAARGVLDDADRFDAAFFGLSAREATVLDPQQRLFLELCWSALEHAAIDPTQARDRVGVYAGSANNSYTPALRQAEPELVRQLGDFATMLGSEKDYIATRVANRLNFKGPALTIQTACSTSLVAVGQAWHALASGQCDVALAGGMTVIVPQQAGYLHIEGGMESSDGTCRPFDAQASGTVFASGGGVVVLKRLSDALSAGDTVYGVIKGVGLNNDGGEKASFTAPSVSGQTEAIRMALDHAGVSARDIGYVEAHGTGTSLGDPIEIGALSKAYAADTAETQYCHLGSIKGHLGHTVAAAGVLGLIKATLALHREQIPGTLHYRQPNPQIQFEQTPFKVSGQAQPWPRQADSRQPRLASVSSFGVGGTNAHVIVQEGPLSPPVLPTVLPPMMAGPTPAADARWILPLSARDPRALQRRVSHLAGYLRDHPGTPLADVAATLMRGRAALPCRTNVVARDHAQAVQALLALADTASATQPLRGGRPRLVWLFPGQGSQHAGMARGLYDEAPAFRDALDRCLGLLSRLLDAPWRHWLIEAKPGDAGVAALLSETRHAQPALFSVSYALACWLDSLGLEADARIGHSVGEWAAACHAGVWSLQDALTAVVARGQAMQAQRRGAMLAVRASASDTQVHLPSGVEIAGINAPALTVVAGDAAGIDQAKASLDAAKIAWTPLKVSHAFHSAAMDPALPVFEQSLRSLSPRPPQGLVYSSLTGEALASDKATDAHYWARQIRGTVQFSKAVLQEQQAHENVVFVEVGAGQALSGLVRQHRPSSGAPLKVVPLLGPAGEPSDAAHLALSALGHLWRLGVPIAWPVPATARRAALPGYPFLGERYWFKDSPASSDRHTTMAATAIAAPSSNWPLAPQLQDPPTMSRLPTLEHELKRILGDVSGLGIHELQTDASLVDQGLDSLSMTQATLEFERVFGIKLRFRRLMEDLDTIAKLVVFLDGQLPPDRFAPQRPVTAAPVQAPGLVAVGPAGALAIAPAAANGSPIHQLIQQQMQLMAQQLALLSGQGMTLAAQPAAAVPFEPASPFAGEAASPLSVQVETAPAMAHQTALPDAAQDTPTRQALVDKPFGASARITLQAQQDFTPAQRDWLAGFIARYNGRTGRSKAYSQEHRKVMADPRVVTGFNPLWKDLVYPIVADRSKGARLWDLDGNEYIDLLSGFGANLLGYQPDELVEAMVEQLRKGIEVGPQHPLSGEVAALISELTGMARVAFCNTGSEAVMGAMRIARTVTGRKTIAIFNNSYHGIFDEVIVRGTRQLRSLSAAPGILANAVENVLVLDYDSEESLRILRERGGELAAIMIEPIQNKYPTLQPHAFVQSLRRIADEAGCALIFDEVVTGFRVAPGGAQEFYGVRADIATYGKIIGGGLPFAAIAGGEHWLDALDGGHWQYGDDSYPEAGVTYFAGTFVRHPLALAAAKASLLHLKRGGRALYRALNQRTQQLVDRLNAAFAARRAPVKAVHCASLWRLSWEDGQKNASLFYYLARFHGLHLYEQFGHFVTEAMGQVEVDRIAEVFAQALDELMPLGLITPSQTAGSVHASHASTSPDKAPLTPGQTERWLAASYDASACRALNESFCLSLTGPVDTAVLKQALQDVLQRHEAFRVRFDLDHPEQTLAPVAPIAIQEVDLSGRPDADAAVDQFCTTANQHNFKLDQAPLAAISLLRLSGGRWVVHLVASHLIFDGWASSVFMAELAQALRARAAGLSPSWPPAESPLRFAQEEQARIQSPQGQDSLRYWEDTLKDPPPLLALGDLAPPRPRRYTANTVRSRFDGAELDTLRARARQSGATLFQLLLTGVTAMLQQRSGQPDFVISIPYASQNLGRHGPLIADGVLDLPLRLGCTPKETGADLLHRVRQRLMDALDQPLATQGTVARALGITSSGDRPALTGVFFNLNPKVDLSGFAPLQASLHEGRKAGSLNDLFFNFYEQDDALTLDLHHSAEFFSLTRAQELVNALRQVLSRLARSLDEPLGASATSAVDPRLLQWNATSVALDSDARIEQWVSRQAAATPDAIALESRGVAVSYRAMEARANRFAHMLIARGVGPSHLVGLCLSRGPDLLPALLGVLKTGAAYVPLDPGFPKDRLHYMVQDADVKLVITEIAHADRSGVSRDKQLRIDDDAAALAAASDQAPSLPTPLSPDAPAYVIYTSGSTGQPKGVVLPHRAVCNFLASMQREPGLQAHDRLLAVTTLSFDIAVLELLLPLVTGARTVIAQREDTMDGDTLIALMADHGITVMQGTPTTWHLLLDSNWQAPKGFRALCGGEPLPPSLAQALLAQGVELWNMYGPTETTVWSTLSRIHDASQKITIGRPIDNTQVWVLDEQGQPCPVGSEGEICIGGLGVALGYFKRPDLTAERFVPDPFAPSSDGAAIQPRLYRTGDLGRWREDGNLEHLGRLDFQVKIRGYRIELGEIEARLATLPNVARTVVVARADTPDDVCLVAYVVPQADTTLDTRQLRDALRGTLPDYMLPRAIVSLPELPLLPNGKIDRKALPAPSTPSSTAAPQSIAPTPVGAASTTGLASTPIALSPASTAHAAHNPIPPAHAALAQTIADNMAALLGQASVGLHDNFFELGGHSLLAARLSAKLVPIIGHRPGLRVLFESPTPAGLANALSVPQNAAAQVTATQIPIRADQSTAPLSQMQRRVWFLENLTPGTVVHNIPTGHRLLGDLDVEAFDRAFRMMLERQAVFRTVIERTPNGDRQRILPKLDFSLLPLQDLSGLPEDERKPAMQRDIAVLVEIPYDLEHGPLFTAKLYRLSPQEHGLLFMTHHLIWDAWSFDLLYIDLPELYDACLTRREPKLPALTVSYGDFAAWHNDWMTGPELARQTHHWVERLTPLPPPLELPLDRPRPPVMSGRGGSHQFNLPKDIADALRLQGQRQGRTLYVALLATYALVVQRFSRQNDFVIGTPVRGREQPPLEPLMGFFVNMLPLRMQFEPGMTMADWLTTLQAKVIESFSYPDVPFEHLVRELNVPRDNSRPPIHQVSFSYQDVRERPTRWGNVEHQRMPTPMLGAAQDLSLWCVETRNHIEFVFTFNTDVLDTASVALFAAQLQAVLQQMVANPALPLEAYRVDAPPKSGAIDAQPYAASLQTQAVNEAFAEPGTPLELAVATVWRQLLGIDQISVHDNFFDLGGHSLLAMRAVTELNRQLGTHLTVRQMIFDTLGQIAANAATAASQSGTALPNAPATIEPTASSASDDTWLSKLVNRLKS